MSETKLLDMITQLQSGTAGYTNSVMRLSYYLLDYVINNNNYNNLVNKIHDYYINGNCNNMYISIYGELEYIIVNCSNLLFIEDEVYLKSIGLTRREYTRTDVSKFFKFSNMLNKKFNYTLKLDAVNNYQLQTNMELCNQLDESLNKASKRMAEINVRIDKINFNTMEIISLFIAIIFALYGGIQLTSSVVNKITIDNYSLMVKTSLFLGYALFILISAILSVLSWHDKSKNKNVLLMVLGALYTLLIIILLFI